MSPYSSSTGMLVSTPWPVMMWLLREWPATTLIWSQVRQRASTTRYSMISEYHLTCLSQGPSYVSPVLPEAAKNLLPSMEEYLAGSDFQGTLDLRVLERAKTLWVAVWLHRLDMAATGDGEASYSLEVAQHGWGPLVEFLLAPQASSLTFEEVVDRVLVENQYKIESSLDNVRGLRAQL